MEGTAGASQLPRVREKGGSNLEAGTLEVAQGEKLGDGGRHNDGTSNFKASKPPVTRRWPKQHHALPPEQPQSRRETHPLKDSTHFPRRPPEETKTERITRVASMNVCRLKKKEK
ncbi:unnamed protein product, partial [Brassica rapa]